MQPEMIKKMLILLKIFLTLYMQMETRQGQIRHYYCRR